MSSGSIVEDNYLYGDNPPEKSGIYIQSSPGTVIRCNDVNNLLHGVQVAGFCTPTDLNLNELGGNQIGFAGGYPGGGQWSTGNQYNRHNTWSPHCAEDAFSYSPNPHTHSQFRVHTGPISIYHPNNQGPDWFIIGGNRPGVRDFCQYYPNPDDPSDPNIASFSLNLNELSEDQFSSFIQILNGSQKWKQEGFEYEKIFYTIIQILKYPELRNNELVSQFESYISSYAIYDLAKAYFKMTSGMDELYYPIEEQIKSGLGNSMTNLVIQKLIQISSDLDGIVTNIDIDSYLKSSLKYKIASYLNDTEYLDANREMMTLISNKCYQIYGISVLLANSCLNKSYDKTITCVELSPRTKSNDEFSLTVYPNPAQNSLTLTSDDEKSFNFTLNDTNGNTVLSGTVSKGINYYDVSALTNGFYILNYENSIGKVQAKKIVIVK